MKYLKRIWNAPFYICLDLMILSMLTFLMLVWPIIPKREKEKTSSLLNYYFEECIGQGYIRFDKKK